MSSELGGSVARIDPALEPPKVVEKLPLGNRPHGLAVVDGSLWVGVADTGARHRGGTLRIDQPAAVGRRDLDPALSFWPFSTQLLNLTNDGLTAFRRQGGIVGGTLVANLAEALPTPSDGGQTYSFRLRRGITYSTGEPVAPSHIRFGIERSVRQGDVAAGFFAGLRGRGPARRSSAISLAGSSPTTQPGRSCSGSRSRTRICRTSWPCPSRSRCRRAWVPRHRRAERSRRPGPTGSPSSRRAGSCASNATRSSIVVRDGASGRVRGGHRCALRGRRRRRRRSRARRTRRSRAQRRRDRCRRLAALRRRAPEQLRASLAPFTTSFVLNTKRAPFDRLAVRRAVSFALDRNAAVAAAGGRDVARGTCQLLPPGFPGSRPYCPFSRPGTDGAVGRPDLARARRLVGRSGTRGMRVTVLSPNGLPPDLPQLMTRTLRKLGYDAVLRPLSPERHFDTLDDTGERPDRPDAVVRRLPGAVGVPAPFTCEALTRTPRRTPTRRSSATGRPTG